jgi:arsenite/tail-anchored protein-transporting ATPase
VSEAASLQDDLRRASIEPWAWVVNRSLARTGTTDPILRRRIAGEASQIARIRNGLARRMFLLPFSAEAPVGLPKLLALT